jgi:hypothetical protein
MALKYANLGLAFILELCLLAAVAYWGFGVGNSTILRIVLGVGTPLLAAGIWGMFLAPKAVRPLSSQVNLLLKAILFGLAVLALAAAGQVALAIIFAALVVINMVLFYALK